MLDVVNGFANGWVATPVISAFAWHGVFEAMSTRPMTLKKLASRCRGNVGHLHAALRLLYELGWIEWLELDQYEATKGAALVRQLPNDLADLIHLSMTHALEAEQPARLLLWLERCGTGWAGADPAVVNVLDGALLAPLLAKLATLGNHVLEQAQPNEISIAALQAIQSLFVQRGWGQVGAAGFRLTPSGGALLASSGALGVVVSYATMFGGIDDLLFGKAEGVFDADEHGHESHIDRTLNVTASGVQHQSHFAELDTLILRIFDQSPLANQPRYVADMGCGDGSLLRRIYELVKTRSARGQALTEYPLTLIGADYNALALEATGKTLAGLPHVLVRADIADPQQLIADLAAAGITDPENILHVRSFLDHDRPFLPLEDKSAARRQEEVKGTGVYVARDGGEIKAAHAVQGLVEHLRRWRKAISRFGLLVLEVHCLPPVTVKRLGDLTESAHFDAYHAFSGQQLVEAPIFLAAAAEAGLFPEEGMSQAIPKQMDFTRISLHRLVPQPYTVRHPIRSDLRRLKQLDRICQPKALHTPIAEIKRRVCDLAQEQWVLEFGGQIVAALYTQRIESLDALRRACYKDMARLHRSEGRCVQLLGLFVAPEMKGRGFSDALIGLILAYSATLDGVDAVVGVTRCAHFIRRQQACSLDDYIQSSNEQGQLLDPMLHFHTSHGAVLREVLRRFRPEDTDNEGAGILIEYPLRPRGAAVAKTEVQQAVPERAMQVADQIEPVVSSTVMQVLGSQRAAFYGAQVPLMEMGLSSLELLELRMLLGARLGESLPSTFLFSYGTPAAIMGYFMARPNATPALQTTVTSTTASSRTVLASQGHGLRPESSQSDEAIALIGMACRLPGGVNTPAQLWEKLLAAHDLVGQLPASRQALWWGQNDLCRWQGGFLSEVDRFDAGFFRISPREAELLDPQQRCLLEVAWEALESAAIAPAMLRGTRSGVFVGMMAGDYEGLIAQHGSEADLNAHFATGNACSVAAGRLSYFFDWQGPALSIDTACSSSLVAVHTACRSLLGGECNLALAAGVNLLLDEKRFLAYEQAGMLSPHGRCRTFDASADGYVRGEGCAAVILKRLSDAQADGDPILAVLRGSAINQDGSSSGLTAPNQLAQQAVIEEALAQAGVAPHEIGYLEAHGTGTKLGDPIEVMAAAQVLGVGRPDDQPLLVGSLKSSIGHLEAAAGIAGLIKTVLSIQHGVMPVQLHFETPNPHIPWARLPVRVVTQTQAWPAGRKRAGISSFGFSGTNAHVIVEEHVAPQRVPTVLSGSVVVVLSARNEERLRDQVQQLLVYLECQDEVNLADLAYTLQVGREALGVRLALVAATVENLQERLPRYARGEVDQEDMYHGRVNREQDIFPVLRADEEFQETLGKWIARGKVGKLAQLWVQGLEVEWGQLYGQTKPQRISLPTYPFAKERYWVSQKGMQGQGGLERQLHPLVHRNTSNLSEQRFSTTLTGEEFFLRDHVVQGERVVPGAAQLEWARAAVTLASGGEVGTAGLSVLLQEVTWLRPLVVVQPQEVQIGLEMQEDGRIRFEIYSGSGDEAVVYNQGWAQLSKVGETPQVDLAALRGQCEQTLTGEACYARFTQLGLGYGPSFQVLHELRLGNNVAMGALRLTAEVPAGYAWLPNVLDGALQTSVALTQDKTDVPLALPFTVAQVRQWGELPTLAWAVVRPGAGDSAAIRKLDVDIVDASGRVALRLSGFSTRLLHEAVDYAEVAAQTVPTPLALPVPVLVGELTLAPVWEGAVDETEETHEAWPLPQQQVMLVGAPEPAQSAWLERYPQAKRILLTGTESMEALIERFHSDSPLDHLVWWVPPANAVATQLGFKLHKALLALGYGSRSLGLTVVTQQAQAVWPREAVDATAAGVHGLMGSLSKEYAHWRVRLLDVPAHEDVPLAWLLKQPADGRGDARAYRHGQGYRQRLVPCTLPAAMGSAYRTGGVYVILGGAGGLGMALSEYLIQHYQAQVVWLGRRAEDATITQQCARLGALGPMPLYLQADATDQNALALAHAMIRERFGAIHGVVHAAIVLADRSLAQMDEATFEAAWSAKVATTEHLTEVFGQEKLDWLVFFSSIQSFMKPPGQSNYAAGCCFADAFAQGMGARSYPVKVMHWGYWGSVGIVASAPYRERMAQMGMGSIESPEAMATLEQLLAGPVDQLVFVKTTQTAVADVLGIEAHETVTALPVAPAVALPQVEAALPEGAAQDITDLEVQLAPLLRVQLAALGWLTADTLPPASYTRWHAHSLRWLEARGLLAQTPGDPAECWAQWEVYCATAQDKPTLRAQVQLVDVTLRALPAVLRGEIAATEVLFPQGRLDRMEGVYRNHPVADYFNAVLTERLIAYVQARLQADPQAKLRILEIGAGTGGTSTMMFAQLAPYASQIEQYCYTDVSAAFLLHAQQHYAPQVPYLHTQKLDIERAPKEQDFALGYYDVIVAANVLHATHDIRRTVRHAKTLLKGNGLLLLNELTDMGLFAHLTFGLLDGWWLAEDSALRIAGTPGLTSPMWQQVLAAEGFETITFPAEAAHGLGQQIVAAFSNGVVRQPHQVEALISPMRSAVRPVQATVRAPGASERHLPVTATVLNASLSTAGELSSRLESALSEVISAQLKIAREELERNTPLSEFGFDSITLTGFSHALNQKYGLTLSPTIFFEYSTIATLAAYLAREHQAMLAPAFVVSEQICPDIGAVLPLSSPILRRRRERGTAIMQGDDASKRDVIKNEPIAVIGMSGCFPQAEDLDALWANLLAERDSIGALPANRWERGLAPAIRHAGVIENIDEFDPLFFGISPREAQGMDPQQRLLMLYVYRVIEDAGYSVQSLSGSATALLVGTSAGNGYGQLLTQAGEKVAGYSAAGLAGSMGPNRMSYWLNWHGPSEPIDTACSSSLVAVHRALELLRSGQCAQAVVGGVNTLLSMEMHESFIQAGMLSADGRCKTFSAQADGYVRGEGVGMVFLKPLSAAERDGDHIYGLIKGSATNHGGRAHSLTAPNPRAQADLIKAALQQAGVEPGTVSYIEAHGTGTELGDPIEIQGLKSAFAELASELPAQSCGLGTVKSNIGHLELAAGVVGLIKVLLQLQHQTLVKSLHCEELNPLLALNDSPFYVVQKTGAWEALRDQQGQVLPRRAGVSSFGFGGVNAHVIVEEYIGPQRAPTVSNGPVVVVLSARSEAQLRDQVQQLLAYLERRAEVNLADLAYTLQVGREVLGVRLALIVTAIEPLQEQLLRYMQGEGELEGMYYGKVKREQDTLSVFRADEELQEAIGKWVVRGKVGKLAQLWVQGLEVEWGQLYGQTKPQRVSLPTYPFAKERYWVPQTVVQGGAERQLHPLVHRNTSSLRQQRFSTTLTGEEFFLRDHVVQGKRVVPGAAQLEWARAAVALASEDDGGIEGLSVLLQDVTWLRPLAIVQPQDIYIGLETQEDGRIGFEIYSGSGDETVVYSQGWAQLAEVGEAPRVDLEGLRGQCEQTLEAEACYARFAQLGLSYGPSFQMLNELQVGDHLAVGALRLAAEVPVGYTWAPNVLDGALQASGGLALGPAGATLALPFTVAQVRQWGEMPVPAWAVVRPSVGDSAAIRKLDVDIVDTGGRVALRLSGFSTRLMREAAEQATAVPQVALLTPQWTVQATAQPVALPAYGAHRILFCEVGEDDSKTVTELATAVPAAQSVRLTTTGTLAQRYTTYAVQLLEWIQKEIAAHPGQTLLLQLVVPSEGEGAVLQGLGGLLRSAQQEYPLLACQVVAVEAKVSVPVLVQRLRAEAVSPTPVVRYVEGQREVWGLASWEVEQTALPWHDEGVYLITGGLGGLGQVFARAIAQQVRHPVLVLTGRRALPPSQERVLEELQTMGARVAYRAVDVSNAVAVATLVAEMVAQYGQLNGVIHSAGVLHDGLLAQKTGETVRQVLAPKVAGLVALDEATREMALDWLVLCSSVASVLGNIGQVDYAAGNGFLDSYAQYRVGLVAKGQRQGRTVSVSWPLWAEGGMQIDAAAQEQLRRDTGLEAMPSATGVTALCQALGQPVAHVVVGYGAVAPVLQRLRAACETPMRLALTAILDADDPAIVVELQSQIEYALTGLISAQLKIAREELERDAPLSEFGFDSVMLTGLGNALNQKYSLLLSPTIFFEYSTIAALAGYLAREYQAELAPKFTATVTAPTCLQSSTVSSPFAPARQRRRERVAAATLRGDVSRHNTVKGEPIAVIGMSGCFPQAEDIDALWANLLAERDSIGALPASRWERGLAPAIRHAGVIENIDEFDPLFFGISPREAQGMDPQQRLLMLYVYRVIEDAGYSVQSLSGSATALLVGTSAGNGYGQLLTQAGEKVAGYSAAGLAGSMGPNRMSYWLNWHGPSEPIDTACSSSLVAVHRALELLRSGQCAQAVVGGVNTLLSMEMHESFIQAGMLSADGRCKTFSARADGYVRGEGVGMVFLKPLSAAERDGDHIYGLIKGSATNHGGRAHSLTAPNPRAQADLIKAALQQAGVEPGTVSYIEAHGTGTELGDPIEVQGLKSAFAELASELPAQSCGLGTVKSNIGHLELAAGVVGLIKVLLQLQHQTLVKSLHCEELNPLLALSGSPFYVVQKTGAWEALRDQQGQVLPRRAGVSSFGFGGVNAHVIVEEYIGPQRAPTVSNGPVVVVLSARSEAQLRDQVQQLLAYLERPAEVNLTDLAYTLQVGREALGVRLALVTRSISALKEQLLRYVRGEAAGEYLYQGEPKRSREALALFRDDEGMQKAIEIWVAKGQVGKLAQLWVQGLEVAWRQLYGAARPKRISLPTYPFAKERYWVPASLQGGLERRLHPLVHRNTSSLSKQRFTTTLTGEEFFLRDHVVQGERVVPGAAQLEWARAAVALASEDEGGIEGLSVLLQEVMWLRPLVIARPQDIYIGLETQEDGRIGFEIYSGSGDETVVYSQGWAQLAEADEAPQMDLAALRGQCEQRLTSEACYARFAQLGLSYGLSFQVLHELWIGDDLAVGALRLSGEGPVGYAWAPNVLDGALQASVGMTQGMTDVTLALPFAVAQVRQWGELPMPAWAVVRPGAGDSAAIRKFDVDIVDANGQVALRLSGFSTRTVHDEAAEQVAAPQTVLLAPQWTAQQAMAQPAAVSAYAGHGILLCEMNEADAKTVTELATTVPAAQCVRLTATGLLAQRYTVYAVQLLEWTQQKVATHPGKALLLQLVVPSEGEGAVLQGLGGLLRSAQQEYPLLVCQVVAVEAGLSMPVLVQRLRAEAVSPAPMVRYVQGQREIWGFAPCESKEMTLPWRDEGVYLITGGLGGLGQVFARAIVQQVRHPVLVLAGRSALRPAQERELQELQTRGARVAYRVVDVTDTVAVATLVAEMVAQYGQLNGVIHSAGVLHDGLLAQKTGETLRQVLAPKVAGLVALDEATRDVALDWLVLCSSVAGVWGNVGQTDYAAANGFLDSYAQYRSSLVVQGQRRGRTVSVSWPLWAEGGMQIDAAGQERLRRDTGLEVIPSAVGVMALYQALGQPAPHVVVGYGAVARVLQCMRAACETPMLPATTVALDAGGPAAVGELPSQIEHALTGMLSTQLKIARQELERDVLLSEFGFDSIAQIAFSNALHQKYSLALSPAIFFEYPTIAALADYLAREHQAVLAPVFAVTTTIRPDGRTVSQPLTPLPRRIAATSG
ncbi:SDR family NAD(P)-dependent oxidoreductase [Mycoavidus sp. HKI]|uniref:SDR family NAD(P)-dependent oxidoreductase n=1 Tax=Mycoavidus sp. HKI TaxID=2840467 RepID=UPI001CBAE5E1|nr:SDR family NAD(P)-dependent oxidoreductase [Mycoavidus sp. HKI]UAW63413.1 SDR family NAD(P)-dependent oxidoreductase [Mycoavidus sp. HKI]